MAQAAAQIIDFDRASRHAKLLATTPLARARCTISAAFYAGRDLEQREAAIVVADAAELIACALREGDVGDADFPAVAALLDKAIDTAVAIMRAPQKARAELLQELHEAISDLDDEGDDGRA